MRVGVGRDFQEISFFGEFRVKEWIMVGFAVVWDVAVENIGKDERRRSATYQMRTLATTIVDIDRQSTYYDSLNLVRWVSSSHNV